MFADKLRKSILQAAIQGKLSKQLPTDGDARQLLREIKIERAKLIKAKKIKAAPPLPPITPDEIPFEIPANWTWAQLGDIIDLLSGRDLNLQDYNSDGKGIPYITGASNFNDEEILINRWTEKPACIAYNGDLLITCKGSVGTMAIINIEKVHIARQIMCIHNSKVFSIHYLKFFLQSKLDYLQKNKRGIIPGIDRKTILEMLIPLPPLAEQVRIVEKLDALLAEIAALAKDEKELAQLEKEFPRKMKASLLQAAIQGKLSKQLPTDGDARALLREIQAERAKLIKAKKIKAAPPLPPITADEIPFEIPANWCWARLGDICEIKGGKRIPVGYKLTTTVTAHKYIRVADMQNGTIISNDVHYVPEDIYPKIKNYVISSSDVYITCAGTIGRVGTVPAEFNGANLTENADKLVFNRLEKIWLKFVLMSPFLQKQIIDSTTKVGQPKLAIKRIELFIVPLPPPAEQMRIVARLEELLKEIEF